MEIQQIYDLINDKYALKQSDLSKLRMLVEKHPYMQSAIFAYLKAIYLHEHTSFGRELKHYSIYINDRKALFFYILSDEYKLFFSHIQDKKLDEDRTDILLSAFFEHQEPDESNNLEYNLTHTTIASSDYFSYLENVEKQQPLEIDTKSKKEETVNFKHQNIIDTFIEKSEESGGITIKINKDDHSLPETNLPQEEGQEDELKDNLYFTETLAKIYIKQAKYEKAYKIIEHLSLNYPKKNVYFADQLNFLEKLIINSKFKDKKQK